MDNAAYNNKILIDVSVNVLFYDRLALHTICINIL